jgi:hypothetical protein
MCVELVLIQRGDGQGVACGWLIVACRTLAATAFAARCAFTTGLVATWFARLAAVF